MYDIVAHVGAISLQLHVCWLREVRVVSDIVEIENIDVLKQVYHYFDALLGLVQHAININENNQNMFISKNSICKLVIA